MFNIKSALITIFIAVLAIPALADYTSARNELIRAVKERQGKIDVIKTTSGIAWIIMGKDPEAGEDYYRRLSDIQESLTKGDDHDLDSNSRQAVQTVAKGARVEALQSKFGGILLISGAEPEIVKLIQSSFLIDGMTTTDTTSPKIKITQNTKVLPTGKVLAKGNGVTTCLVTGEKLANKKIFTLVNGKKYYTCCPVCKAKIEKNPPLYIKGYTK